MAMTHGVELLNRLNSGALTKAPSEYLTDTRTAISEALEELMRWMLDDAVALYAARCRAMVLPGEEDFGITTVEVNAAGRPVIAFKAGGALENITENLNGVFFDKQTAASIVEAMESLEARDWNPGKIREHAENWDITVFTQ